MGGTRTRSKPSTGPSRSIPITPNPTRSAAPRWPRLAWIHLPAVAWGVGIELTGAICPLTPLELWLRIEAGAAGYEGDFIAHYLLPVLYPAGLTRQAQLALGALACGINAAAYGWWGYRAVVLRRGRARGARR